MKRKISLWLMILVMIGMPLFVMAEQEEQIKRFYAGNNVTVEKDVDASTFAVGETVELNPIKINGLGFAAGNNVTISSEQDHIFVAGNSVNLKEAVAKDAYIAGNIVKIESSTIRDLFVAANKIELYSGVRNAHIGGTTVILNTSVEGNIKIAADKIEIGEDTIISGTLEYPNDAEITISDKASIENTKTYDGHKEAKTTSLKNTLVNKIASFVSLFLIGVILLALFPSLFENWKKEEKDASICFKKALKGILTLIVVPVAAILLLITIIGIPLSLISIALYIILIYLSKLITAYYLGSWILKDQGMNNYLLLGGSLLVIYILEMIPVLGGLIRFLSLILGLGIAITSYKRSTEKEEE